MTECVSEYPGQFGNVITRSRSQSERRIRRTLGCRSVEIQRMLGMLQGPTARLGQDSCAYRTPGRHQQELAELLDQAFSAEIRLETALATRRKVLARRKR